MSYANHTKHVHCVRKLESLRILRRYENICFQLQLRSVRREMFKIMLYLSLALSSLSVMQFHPKPGANVFSRCCACV
jgi:hypothetical protein